MEKKEKKSEWIKIISVWQLMKSLMDKKWIPRWDNRIVHAVYDIRHKMIWLYEDDWKEYFELVSKKSLRELVSTDSWLWQFVCENKMIPYDEDWYTWYERTKDYYDDFENSNSKMLDLAIDNWYEYRVIESALKDESELEQFLLDNIKVWNEQL